MNSVFGDTGTSSGITGASKQVVSNPNIRPRDFDPTAALHVSITREPGLDWLNFALPNGYTEELEPEQARTWLKERGANMDVAEKALDRAWNFGSANLWIAKPKMAPLADPTVQPDIGDGRLDVPSVSAPHSDSVQDGLPIPRV